MRKENRWEMIFLCEAEKMRAHAWTDLGMSVKLFFCIWDFA